MSIQIIQADITKLPFDAIVNAANNSLLGGGGVDGAIHNAAGPQLLEECRSLGGCKTGEAKITRGYNLPARYVIHTVGPVYHGSDKDAEFLAKCYENSLELAKSNRLKSIAFCAISTGAYGYPIKEATQIALTTVNNWLKQNKDYALKVVFCCYSKHDTDIYINTALALKIASREENIWVPRIVFSHKNKRISHCLPMSSYCVEQRVDLQLDERMVRNMLDSHISCDMGDHWDLLYEDGKIYCYRSWTGYCIYVADVSPSGHISRVLVCQDENQYSASVEDAVATCLKIIPGYFKHDQDYYDD